MTLFLKTQLVNELIEPAAALLANAAPPNNGSPEPPSV